MCNTFNIPVLIHVVGDLIHQDGQSVPPHLSALVVEIKGNVPVIYKLQDKMHIKKHILEFGMLLGLLFVSISKQKL